MKDKNEMIQPLEDEVLEAAAGGNGYSITLGDGISVPEKDPTSLPDTSDMPAFQPARQQWYLLTCSSQTCGWREAACNDIRSHCPRCGSKVKKTEM